LVAQAVHALSSRTGRFVGVNCGALPATLVESELFGVRRGAFTGANEDRVGLVRSSDHGTLFLDEVAELAESAQATLLRVLQEREVLSLGANKPVSVDLRLVTATHRNLESLVLEKRFRDDLLARISGFTIRLPTLRERLEDFGIILSALLARHVAHGESLPTITPGAMRLLLRYPWPRNVRELENCVRGTVVLSPRCIDVEHLPEALREPPPSVTQSSTQRRQLSPKQLSRRADIHKTVHDLLVQYRGNVSAVARHMGKEPIQIRRWMQMFELSADDFRD
jgi:transcriptional regulator with PAS, ATPase and Fis domain